ncbi:MAG: hypothetical protein OEY22_05615 [Candidatus Bathyarchaeota archaeon]|nr:hypothetical protein [Candidatus Bathyarchaeota archaeon]MDH5787957.1 hypothetical protein [Candidatus Bathyarchaeota archaeon]
MQQRGANYQVAITLLSKCRQIVYWQRALSLNSGLKEKIRRIRNFLIGLGLISMLATRGRAIVYYWIRMRQQRTEEREREGRKHRKELVGCQGKRKGEKNK